MNINLDVSRKVFNKKYIPYLNDQRRTQIFFGGASSGKSYFFLAQRTVLDLVRGGRNFLVVRNIARTNRSSTFNEICKGINTFFPNPVHRRRLFEIRQSDMTITCIANGYQICFAGLDDVKKLKSITPAKSVFTDIVVEEATEISYDSYKELNKRLRGRTYGYVKKRMTLLFNPVYKLHWLYREFFSLRWRDTNWSYHDDHLVIVRTTYRDNLRFLTKEDVKDLEGETDPYYRAVYTEGLWGVLGDVVFSNWKVEDLSTITPELEKFNNGLDFGYSNDPTALHRSSLIHAGEDLLITNELYERGLDNEQIANRIRPIIGREYVVCDSAEPKSIHELKHRYKIRAVPSMKGRDSVMFGIQWLQRRKNIIIDQRCQNHINEFSICQYQKDKDGNSLNKIVDKHNHLIDATRYAYDRIMTKKTPLMVTEAHLTERRRREQEEKLRKAHIG